MNTSRIANYLFETLDQVRDMGWVWILDDNDERTDDALGKLARQKIINIDAYLVWVNSLNNFFFCG